MKRLLICNLRTDADDPVLGFTTDWLNALAQHCDVVDVVTMRVGQLELAENVRVLDPVLGEKISPVVQAGRLCRVIEEATRRSSPDACFFHMTHMFVIPAWPILRSRRIPMTLWHTHARSSPTLRVAERLVDLVLSASEESFPFKSRKLLATGHGIDTITFAPCPVEAREHEDFKISTIGRLSPIKQVEVVMEALQLLLSERPSTTATLRIVGAAPDGQASYLAMLHERRDASACADRIDFTGPVSHTAVVSEMQSADVVVNLSGTNSLDKAVLEAMSCGVPVITSNLAFREILAPWAQLLFLSDASPTLLADRLRRLKNMAPDARRDLGCALRRAVVEKHNLDRLARRLATEVLPNARWIGS